MFFYYIDINGKNNTNIILTYASANNTTTQAATATSLYYPSICTSGTFCGKGEWYLPAMGELITIYNNLNTIDNAFSKAGGRKLNQGNYYWSSNEQNAGNAWGYGFYFGNISHNLKNNYFYVRPVLAF